MIRRLFPLLLMLVLAGCAASPWKAGGRVVLPALTAPWRSTPGEKENAVFPPPSRVLAVSVPAEWSWLWRGDDLLATREGVFLSNLSIERFHLAQRQPSALMFPRLSLTALAWPLRTAVNLSAPLTPGLSPDALIDALLAARRGSKGVEQVTELERGAATLAGRPAGRVVYELRLQVGERRPLYRVESLIAFDGEWCEVVTASALRRHYLERDRGDFAALLASLGEEGSREGGRP